MVGRLSDKNNSLQVVPVPQSPARAGFLQQWPNSTMPSGWMECSGQEVSRTQYAQLFANIGTKYGEGDGSTTFNLPNGPRSTVEVDIELTGGNGWTQVSAKGTVSQDMSGLWFLRLNTYGTKTANTNGVNLDVTGATPDGAANQTALSAASASDGIAVQAYCAGAVITVRNENNASFGSLRAEGVVPLTGKPTDAFVGVDGRFSTFDEALDSIPIIKLYNDEANVAVSDVAATPTQQGQVQLSESFEATETTFGFIKKPNTPTQAANLLSGYTPGRHGSLAWDDINDCQLTLQPGMYLIEWRISFIIGTVGATGFSHAHFRLANAGDFNTANTINNTNVYYRTEAGREEWQDVYSGATWLVVSSEQTISLQESDVVASVDALSILATNTNSTTCLRATKIF